MHGHDKQVTQDKNMSGLQALHVVKLRLAADRRRREAALLAPRGRARRARARRDLAAVRRGLLLLLLRRCLLQVCTRVLVMHHTYIHHTQETSATQAEVQHITEHMIEATCPTIYNNHGL